MFLKRILPLGLIIFAAVFAFWRYSNPPCIENSDYSYQHGWQGENPFEIKLERVPERCILFPALGGANYIFSSRSGTSGNWQKVFTSHADDLFNVSSDNVRVLNEKVAFAFILHKFAVTTNGGKSWTISEVDKNLPKNYCCRQTLIQDVDIEDDGNGLVRLNFTTNEDNKVVELRTENFGRTWSQ